MLTPGVGSLLGADPSPLPQSLATGSPQPASVYLHHIFKKEPPVWTLPWCILWPPGCDCTSVRSWTSLPANFCQPSRRSSWLPGPLQLSLWNSTLCICPGFSCGPCDQWLSQSRPSVTRSSSPEYSSTLLLETLGAISNSSSDVKFNDFGVCSSGYLAASLYPVCTGAQRHGLGVNTSDLQCYQALVSSAVLVVVVPFFESACGAQIDGLWFVSALLMMLLSGIRVVRVDFSIYWISGYTSTVTHDIFRHFKFWLASFGGCFI